MSGFVSSVPEPTHAPQQKTAYRSPCEQRRLHLEAFSAKLRDSEPYIIAVMPNGWRRSKVVASKLSPSSRARRQQSASSMRVGERAISAYLSRYLSVAGSQKLSGRNWAITFTGADGTCSAIHSSTG